MRKLAIVFNMFVCLSVCGQTIPSDAEAKRHWELVEFYLEEDTPEYAIDELRHVIYYEDFAPAYMKLVELCYATGKTNYIDYAEELVQTFEMLWPERRGEIRDAIAKARAKEKVRMKRFYDSLIGEWHPEKIPLNESYVAMKIYRDSDGKVKVDVPARIFDGDFVTAWQTTSFIQWDGDEGLYLNRVNSTYGETYGVDASGHDYKSKWEVQIYIPFGQNELTQGRLKIKYRIKLAKDWLDWSDTVLISD